MSLSPYLAEVNAHTPMSIGIGRWLMAKGMTTVSDVRRESLPGKDDERV